MTDIKNMTPHDILKRWPRIAAHMICESLGYFTPISAALAIQKAKLGEPYFCEWYSDMSRRRCGDLFDDEETQKITKEVLTWAIQSRKRHTGFMSEYRMGRQAIEQELKGRGPELASWF